MTNLSIFLRSQSHQEKEVLKTYLQKAQDDITNLLDEKRRLMETVRALQVNLFFIRF